MYLRKGYIIIVTLLILLVIMGCVDESTSDFFYVLPDHSVRVKVVDKWAEQINHATYVEQVCMAKIEFETQTSMQVKAQLSCEMWNKVAVDQICYFDKPVLTCEGYIIWQE